ncbi:ABC transporter substrate-binding protein [Pseudomonas syringae]|uniref:ABC transporter substrate-binding protein n=1 Tax=Pseudomonas syringae TaxID=317 RepID=A0A085VIJ8_PSESX|nr:ABC transporter substrate-binding protein [Pseudomonas syringae]KFE55261.1 ABC transporter substrate-binding protein [Pseudomonas syringae]
MKKPLLRALLAATAAATFTVQAQDPVRIGFITTLSTPAGYLGEDSRDGFQLAIDQEDGKLGGVPVQMVIEDDGLQPAKAKQIVDRMSLDGIQLYTGVIFSNVLAAMVNTALEKGFYVSNNTAPSNLAGAQCKPNYFVASYQNDLPHEMAGRAANELGYKKMVILAPNYQGGRDALEGFKRTFKGEVTEIYTKLNQLDFSVELARVRSLAPDAIFQFHPGGAGINFAKQYGGAGLNKTIPMVVPVFSMDERMLAAVGDVAKGTSIVTLWNPQSDNPANQAFVKAFTEKYHRVPTVYAAQTYDTARLIGAALKASGGKVSDAEVFRTAMRNVKFDSIRGDFRFAKNQHSIIDWYLLRVEADASGKLVEVPVKTIAKSQVDSYAEQCAM